MERLPKDGLSAATIMISPSPQVDGNLRDPKAEAEISLVMQTIRAVRNARSQLRIPAGQQLEAVVQANGLQRTLEEESAVIRALSRIEPLRIISDDTSEDKSVRGITLLVNPLVVKLPLEGVVDLNAEASRLRDERDDCQKNLDRVSALVSNPNFLAKAKPEVVETEQERLKTLEERKQRLEEILAQLEE